MWKNLTQRPDERIVYPSIHIYKGEKRIGDIKKDM